MVTLLKCIYRLKWHLFHGTIDRSLVGVWIKGVQSPTTTLRGFACLLACSLPHSIPPVNCLSRHKSRFHIQITLCQELVGKKKSRENSQLKAPYTTISNCFENKKNLRQNLTFDLGFHWRRKRDSNPRGFGPNGFQGV